MRRQSKKTRLYPALTLTETVTSLAIMAIIFAVLLPQLRTIQNSWDSQAGASETLQNGRVLTEHLHRNLSKAARITAVSDSSTTSGYIEFIDNDANSFRYDINSTSNYVEFGPVGSLSDLAGPVSQLQFTCYDGNDFDTSITDANSVRFIKVQTTLTNPAGMAQDKTFASHAYLRTGGGVQGSGIDMGTPFEYDTVEGRTPALAQIDSTHYLCAYGGDKDDGWAVVLTVDTGTWQVTKETPFEFDAATGVAPALAQIDSAHYLCVYQGRFSDGWAVVLTVDSGTWQITRQTPLEFDTGDGLVPAIAQIDSTHYLCAYQGPDSDGWAVVLTVDTGTWQITKETPFEYDDVTGIDPALAQIDATHYLCAYEGNGYDGWAVVLTVDTGTWQITKETPFEYNTATGRRPALTQIDSTHYLCAYQGPGDNGWAVVLAVNAGTWQITKEVPFEFDGVYGNEPALAQIDPNDYFCAYAGPDSDGWVTVLTVDSISWEITQGTPFEYDIVNGIEPAFTPVDPNNYLCAYHGPAEDGWAVVLKPGSGGDLLP